MYPDTYISTTDKQPRHRKEEEVFIRFHYRYQSGRTIKAKRCELTKTDTTQSPTHIFLTAAPMNTVNWTNIFVVLECFFCICSIDTFLQVNDFGKYALLPQTMQRIENDQAESSNKTNSILTTQEMGKMPDESSSRNKSKYRIKLLLLIIYFYNKLI